MLVSKWLNRYNAEMVWPAVGWEMKKVGQLMPSYRSYLQRLQVD